MFYFTIRDSMLFSCSAMFCNWCIVYCVSGCLRHRCVYSRLVYRLHQVIVSRNNSRVSNTPGNPGNLLEIYSLVEIFGFSSRVCVFVINISYNSCISECISAKYLAVNHGQLIWRLVIPGKCQLTHLLIG